MKNLIVIFACLVTAAAYATPKDSTADSVELLPAIHISTTLKNRTDIYSSTFIKDGGGCGWSYRYYYANRDLFNLAGTRNLYYYINFSVKSSNIGFDEPHFNGARADGNALFIDGVRMLPNSPTEFNIIGLK